MQKFAVLERNTFAMCNSKKNSVETEKFGTLLRSSILDHTSSYVS